MSTEFGQRLKAARKHAKKTQKQLGPLVGMSQSNMSDLENEAHSSGYTVQLAAACGVNPRWLATGEGSMLDGAQITANAPAAPAIDGAEAPSTPAAQVPTVVQALERLGAELALLPKDRRAELIDTLAMWVRYGDAYRNQVELILTAPGFQQSPPRKTING